MAHLDDFVASMRTTQSLLTIKAYTSDARDFLNYLITRNIQLEDVTSELFEQYREHLRTTGYKPASINRKMGSLSTFFRYLVKVNVLKAFPELTRTTVPVEATVYATVTDNEKVAIVGSIKGKLGVRDRAMMAILLSTGMTPATIVNMTKADIDLQSNKVRCVHRDNVKWIEMPNKLLSYVTAYIEQYDKIKWKDHQPDINSLLFPNHFGNKMSARSVRRNLEHLCHRASVPFVSITRRLSNEFWGRKNAKASTRQPVKS